MERKQGYIRKLIREGKRPDGRAFEQFRPVEIESSIIGTAEGSARARIGNSHVIAGVKLSVREPFADTPGEGMLIVDCELVPVASPTFEPGPPNEDAIEIARVVDRGIRESKTIDLEKLCITPGELVWCVHIDLHVLDHDGNLLDACALAAIAALLSTKLPRYDEATKRIIREPTGPLPVRDKPVAVTIGKIDSTLLIDTSLEEEAALDARVTFATNAAGNICAIQKGGKGFFTLSELAKAADLAITKGVELRAMLG
jgi:exosome complex component RRP42